MIFFRALVPRETAEDYRVGFDFKIEDGTGVMTCECIEKTPASEAKVLITFVCPRRPDVEGGFVLQHDNPPPLFLTVEVLGLLKRLKKGNAC